ncbi:MAG TPA: hypothetical protein DCK83_04450 [Gallionellaceae bacterium]|nr:hypothetical protein [Gallionellaceae bacterium]
MQIISWAHLDDYIRKGIPAQLPVTNRSEISFMISDHGKSLGLRLPVSENEVVIPSPYRELDISKKTVYEITVIELTVQDVRLFRTFYHFAIEILQLVLVQELSSTNAIERCLSNWAQMLLRKKLLEETEQVGLAGELCFLKALIESRGQEAFNSWLGPTKEPHDFRLATNEIEVKSTLQPKRIHRIHGLGQLEPSSGMQLYILSLQFEAAGNALAGRSLVERVDEVRQLLLGAESSLQTFEEYLRKLGYVEADSVYYSHKLKFRSLPKIIPVNAEFPRLTRAKVDQVLPQGTSQRLTYVEYDLDVDGFGYPEGSPEFDIILDGLSKMENPHE